MADADEDAIHLPASHDSAQVENDLSDETQDFRFLNHLALYVHVLSTGNLPYDNFARFPFPRTPP